MRIEETQYKKKKTVPKKKPPKGKKPVPKKKPSKGKKPGPNPRKKEKMAKIIPKKILDMEKTVEKKKMPRRPFNPPPKEEKSKIPTMEEEISIMKKLGAVSIVSLGFVDDNDDSLLHEASTFSYVGPGRSGGPTNILFYASEAAKRALQ